MQNRRPNPFAFFAIVAGILIVPTLFGPTCSSSPIGTEVSELREEVETMRKSMQRIEGVLADRRSVKEPGSALDAPVVESNPVAVRSLLAPYSATPPGSEERESVAAATEARLFDRTAAEIRAALGRPTDYWTNQGLAVWAYEIEGENRAVQIRFASDRVANVQIF